MSDSLWPHVHLPTRLLCPWDSPGKNTGVGRQFLFQGISWPRDRTHVSCIGRHFFTAEPPGKPPGLYGRMITLSGRIFLVISFFLSSLGTYSSFWPVTFLLQSQLTASWKRPVSATKSQLTASWKRPVSATKSADSLVETSPFLLQSQLTASWKFPCT